MDRTVGRTMNKEEIDKYFRDRSAKQSRFLTELAKEGYTIINGVVRKLPEPRESDFHQTHERS